MLKTDVSADLVDRVRRGESPEQDKRLDEIKELRPPMPRGFMRPQEFPSPPPSLP
jgi:hypothetical protein